MDYKSCAGCKMPFQSKEFMSCDGCKKKYDLACAGLSPKRFKRLTDLYKREWRCFECKSKVPRGDNSNTPVRSSHLPRQDMALKDDNASDVELSSDSSNVTMRRKEISKKAAEYITDEKLRDIWKNEMSKEMESLLESTIKRTVAGHLKNIDNQCTGFQESLSYVSTQYDDLKKELTELKNILGKTSSEMKILKDENKFLRENLDNCMTRVKNLEAENLKQQQWSRLQNIEITGVPEGKDEDTSDIVEKLTRYVGVDIQSSDLEFAHRVQPRRAASAARARPIVVRLRRRSVKDQIIAAGRKRRNLTAADLKLGGDSDRIFINEHLTKNNKLLLNACKEKAKEAHYKYVWTKNCRIYVRKNDGTPAVPIDSTSDLIKIV